MSSDKKKPNILFIMTDQQRPDSLMAYGCEHNFMPRLNRMAQDGLVFDNCYTQNPLCCPSRYSILTGRYPHCHGVRANWYAPRQGETSFAHQIGRAGYATALIGKMHLTPWHDRFGFDGRIIAESKFHTTCPDDYERFLNRHGWSRRDLYDFDSTEYIENHTAVASKLPQELHIDSFVGRATCEYLRQASEPFCAVASFLGPHNPYDPPQPYDQLYADLPMAPRNMGEKEVLHKPREAYDYINRRLKNLCPTDALTETQLQKMKAYYFASCTLIDDWIGRILDTLEATGSLDDTIIFFMSDHGDLLGDHGLVYKQCFYEQSVKTPFIVYAPSRIPAGRSSAFVETVDLLNTFCELAGADPGHGRQGKSLVPMLEKVETRQSHREAAFSENYFGRMVRHGDYKMVYYPGKSYGELYNLKDDPAEQNNLWDYLEGSPVKQHLKDLLLEWAFASQDPLPLPVRPDHQDQTPPDLCMVAGRVEEAMEQNWRLPTMAELYKTWDFQELGRLR